MRAAALVLMLASLYPAGAPGAAAPARLALTVSEVVIEGSRRLPVECVLNLMKTRVGRPYWESTLQEDLRTLYGTREFGNVCADVRRDGEGRVQVIVYAKEAPGRLEKVSYQGTTSLSQDELDRLTEVRVNSPCNPIANEVACRRITQRLNEDGRLYASCELLKGDQVGEREVIFNITEGPKVQVRSIRFKGNRWASNKQLEKALSETDARIRAGAAGECALLDFYREHGFLGVVVTRELLGAGPGVVDVVFHVSEGKRLKPKGTREVIRNDLIFGWQR